MEAAEFAKGFRSDFFQENFVFPASRRGDEAFGEKGDDEREDHAGGAEADNDIASQVPMAG